MIYIATTAFNAEKTLEQCVESILNQTYGNFIYYLCDNGSTDKTGEMVKKYAQQDSRIRPILNSKNHVFEGKNQEYWDFRKRLNDDDFFCTLDSDDSYSLTFLEELIHFIKDNNLDFAASGSTFIDASTHNRIGERKISESLIMDSPAAFQNHFPVYYQFMRTVWGKVYTGKIARAMYTEDPRPSTLWPCYGGDTMTVLTGLHHSKRFGIYHKSLHQYYISQKSTSYRYSPNRFESDIYLYQYALDFLKSLGPVSSNNLLFLHLVYANALVDTISVLHQASLSPEEKFSYYSEIIRNPVTQKTYGIKEENCKNSKSLFLQYVLADAQQLNEEGSLVFDSIIKILLPNCCKALSVSNCSLFLLDEQLFQTLLTDNKSLIFHEILQYFKKVSYNNQLKILDILGHITDDPIVKIACSYDFLVQFSSICSILFQKEYVKALDEMTELLLNDRVKDAQETFFELYLTLAALLQQEPAFLFGKIRFAEYLFSKKHYAECANTILELEQMGLSGHEEVEKLKKKLSHHTLST